ncbi:hypothetical protein EHS43_18505 [Streptomyces sp. RP5T]|nr:hypothetical protein EHS43_18505 [Streptomyces sp. RP5T]
MTCWSRSAEAFGRNGDARFPTAHHPCGPADAGTVPWRRRGPCLSERQWGTVREYSEDGIAGDREEPLS